ncbi:EH domain-containing protein 3-like [Stylophora pistillata]|uniref:EH domain-containing protein 1 n=1 Tax=Stylophora pistillata TaxID=50429 RepID=A0A2B4RZW1_STYPI|nr:EH domain-containing protein 3-like [Stylophora pistillata]PFX22313.1 EH domain-containing protein 1 [Stylophora pistillata]
MFSWMKKNDGHRNPQVFGSVVEGLKKLYFKNLKPLEESYLFNDFHSPVMTEPDFVAKPMVLLVGQYSTGKTTFIRYLLERDFPGIRVGPEPTTDSFIAVMHGEKEQVIPGNALMVDPQKPFRTLDSFGNAFLNRFCCSELPSPVLESISIVDTPGILSGEKQSVSRGYDFTGILKWFAERCDRIILLFDAHKLDISDEFQRGIEVLRDYDDKIRIVLNKADMVTTQQLMRVYGALMWSLGKVINTPEVARVYIGSFWDQPLQIDENRKLFECEASDLFSDIQTLPRNAALRKLNDFIKRARLAKVHAYVIAELKNQMPAVFGKDKKKEQLLNKLSDVYMKIQKEQNISPGDFPPVLKMKEQLRKYDFSKFAPLKTKLIESLDRMLANEIPRLMAMIPLENESESDHSVQGGAFTVSHASNNPFASGACQGAAFGAGSDDWVVQEFKHEYDKIFKSLNPQGGKISGAVAKKEMTKSKLQNNVLGKIWTLADIDRDGKLDEDEFALAMYLIKIKLEDDDLPEELSNHLIPPSKRLQSSIGMDYD